MAAPDERIIRRHRRRTDDGKGYRRLIAGRRFRLPAGLDAREAEQRFLRIETLWRDNERFCQGFECELAWTKIALWAAEFLRWGDLRIPLPPLSEILGSYVTSHWPNGIINLLCRYLREELPLPRTVDDLTWDEAMVVYEFVSDRFPSINWLLPVCHAEQIISAHETVARGSIERLSRITEQMPPDPSTPLVSGTLHEALRAYEEERRRDFTRPDGSFVNSGHHMLGIIRAVRERSTETPLAQLDFARCQALVDSWRERPENTRTGDPPVEEDLPEHPRRGQAVLQLAPPDRPIRLEEAAGLRVPQLPHPVPALRSPLARRDPGRDVLARRAGHPLQACHPFGAAAPGLVPELRPRGGRVRPGRVGRPVPESAPPLAQARAEPRDERG